MPPYNLDNCIIIEYHIFVDCQYANLMFYNIVNSKTFIPAILCFSEYILSKLLLGLSCACSRIFRYIHHAVSLTVS